MRRLPRLDRSFDLLRSRSTAPLSSPFHCSACGRPSPFSTSIPRAARQGSLSYTEKMRRKIWGTDQPPGQEDPYGGPSFADERKATRVNDQRKAPLPNEEDDVDESERESQKTSNGGLDAYEPAETWDGLIEVGELPLEKY